MRVIDPKLALAALEMKQSPLSERETDGVRGDQARRPRKSSRSVTYPGSVNADIRPIALHGYVLRTDHNGQHPDPDDLA